MKNPRIMSKVITGVLAGSMILSAGSVAFAKTVKASDTTKPNFKITQKKNGKQMIKNMPNRDGMKLNLDSQVKAAESSVAF